MAGHVRAPGATALLPAPVRGDAVGVLAQGAALGLNAAATRSSKTRAKGRTPQIAALTAMRTATSMATASCTIESDPESGKK
jgi:hypothetical protein